MVVLIIQSCSTNHAMINRELASIFEDLADMEEIEDNKWKSLAYRKVAASISLLPEDIVEIYQRKGLRNIPGVGESIEKKIIEYIETGKISKHEELMSKFGIDLDSMRDIQGLGPKRIMALYNALGTRNLDDLIEAIRMDRVKSVPGFGDKSQLNLEKAIQLYLENGSDRIPIALIYDDVQNFAKKLRDSGHFTSVEVAGSIRRFKETIGDIDILVASENPPEAGDYFTSLKEVKHTNVKGDTKISVLLNLGLNCDLRIMGRKSLGAALQYFTGSKEHNIRVRDIAIKAGLKLNEYGLYKGNRIVAGATEQGVYESLGMKWIPPEMRENMGEIEASLESNIPSLVDFEDVKGDFHVHTNATDGFSSLEEIIEAAKLLGHKFIAITEHSKSLKIAKGMDEKRFRERNILIESMNENAAGIRILKGVELEILKDGALDLPTSLLKDMDVVVGALHQGISDDPDMNTNRLVTAIESGMLTTIAHPTGRLIGYRDPIKLNFDRIFKACEDHDVALEINGQPSRSDLPYNLVKKAREYEVRFTLGSDAHSTSQLKYLKFATAIARKGWLEKRDVLNATPL